MQQFTNRELEVLKKAIRDRKATYEEYIDECDEILKKLNNMQLEEVINEEEQMETYDIKTLWKTMTFNGGEITLRIKSDNKWYPVIEINADGVYYFFKIAKRHNANITTNGWVYNSDVEEIRLNGQYIKVKELKSRYIYINK